MLTQTLDPGARPLPSWPIRKSVGMWWLLLPVGLVMVAVLPRILPEQYLFDAQTIRELILGPDRPAGFELGESFGNTAYLYVMLGIGSHPLKAAYVTYVTSWFAVLVALRLAQSGGRFWLLVPLFVWHSVLVAFTGMHSKEVHAMPALAALLIIAGDRFTWRRIAAMTLLVLLYSLYFRKYWLIVGVLTAGFMIVRARQPSMPAWAGMLGVFGVVLVAYHLASGEYLTDWRIILTEGRDLDLFSDTAFANPFSTESILDDLANSLVVTARLLFPWPLLALGKPQHVAAAIWETCNALVFSILIFRIWRDRAAPARLVFAAAWVVAFTLTQALFEADYGTFLRHQTTLLPMLGYILLEGTWRRGG